MNMNSGYKGYSMSNRAAVAYELGEKPLSKWLKEDLINEILEIAEVCDKEIDKKLLKKIKAKTLKNYFLYCSSWHHTSAWCNRTDFYSVDEDKVVGLTTEKIQELVGANPTKEEPTIEKWECAFLEWSGTRRHPKATEVIEVGEVKGNWFYRANGTKKSVNANGFRFLKRI